MSRVKVVRYQVGWWIVFVEGRFHSSHLTWADAYTRACRAAKHLGYRA
jgi:hypothetical protein